MTSKIRSWHAKYLSYVARLQLINSVLMSISTYWCHIFVFPKKVINHINAVCTSFLWFDTSENGQAGNVSWKKVCTPKKYGGSRHSNLALWNTIAIGKIARHIGNMKESPWVKWIHNVCTKGGNWRIFYPSPIASWSLRKLYKVRRQWMSGCLRIPILLVMYTVGKWKLWIWWDEILWFGIGIPS